MNRPTQYLSLAAGLGIFGYGLVKLFEGDWVLFILGLLIVGFSLSKIMRSRADDGPGDDVKK